MSLWHGRTARCHKVISSTSSTCSLDSEFHQSSIMNIVFCFEGLPYAEEQFSHRFFKHGGTYFPFYILYLYFVFEFVFVFQFLEVLKFVFEFSEAIFSQVLQTRWHFFPSFPTRPSKLFPPDFPTKLSHQKHDLCVN